MDGAVPHPERWNNGTVEFGVSEFGSAGRYPDVT